MFFICMVEGGMSEKSLQFEMSREESHLALESLGALVELLENHVNAHRDAEPYPLIEERDVGLVEGMYWRLREQFKATFGVEP